MQLPNQESSKTIRILQDTLGPNTTGILWFTKENLNQLPSPFESLDYFFEGTLTQNIKNNGQSNEKKNFFITRCFGEPFFLAHLVSGSGIDSDLKEIFQIIENLQQKANTIVVIDGAKLDMMSQLKKKYPKKKFTALELK